MSVWKSDETLLSICILNFSFKNDFVWEEMTNIRHSVSLPDETPRSLSKILRCEEHFQLSSRCFIWRWSTAMHAWYITSIVPFHPPPLLVNHPQAYRVLKSTLVHSALAFFLEKFLSIEEIVLTEENPARHPWAVSGRSFLLSGSAGRVHGRLQISHLAEKKERGEKKHNSVNWICMKMLVIIRMQ